ncbi:MAG TPA: hypothetical protein V6C69_17875 [Trichormus sp.]
MHGWNAEVAKIRANWLVLLVAVSGLLLGQTKSFAADQGLVLTQNGMMLGKSKIYIQGDKIRVDLLGPELNTLLLPGSKVVIYNTGTKLYCETNAANWRGFMGSQAEAMYGSDFSTYTWLVLKHETVAGLPATCVVLRKGESVDRTGRKYWFSSGIPVADVWLRVFGTKQQLPKFLGVPLRTEGLKTVTPISTFLTMDTISCSKQAVKPDVFSIPKGYKQVPKQEDVERSNGSTAILEDLRDTAPSYERRKRHAN